MALRIVTADERLSAAANKTTIALFGTQRDGALAVAGGDDALDPVAVALGIVQRGGGVFLQQGQMLGWQRQHLIDRQAQHVVQARTVGAGVVHHATSRMRWGMAGVIAPAVPNTALVKRARTGRGRGRTTSR